ncbi:2-alkenal reductase (NADP(+)-dependent) [Fagus crenata]
MEEVDNNQVIFKGYIETLPKETDMELKVSKIKLKAPKGSGAILVKNLYLSCDPFMRGRMRDFQGSYIPPFVPGQALEGFGVYKVIDSDNPDFKPGDLYSGLTGWEEYSLIHRPQQFRKIQADDIPLSYHVGLLGMPGFTAYVGFFEVCTPKKGEYVFVSAASGAVGQLVGQLAKLHGCYVVGSAGTSQKVDLLKNKLGFNEAFNYKEETDLDAALKRYFPQGIDIYFDNVGGDMLDAALLNMRINGRIAVCGAVSQQSLSKPQGIHNLYNLIIKSIKMQGFLQHNYLHLYPSFLDHVIGYYKQGKIVYIEDMNEGLESGPAAFAGLFFGENVGKQVIRVASE